MMAVESLSGAVSLTPSFLCSDRGNNSICSQFSRFRRPTALAAHKRSDEEKNSEESHKLSAFPLSKFHAHESLSLQRLTKETAMVLVFKAAVGGKGWTTGSGMEGPAVSTGYSEDVKAPEKSIYPWALFTKSPRRRMRVAFTCGVCGQRTTRAINPHAYTDGTVFVQCAGCDVYHKLVDNLNLFHDLKGGIFPMSANPESKKSSPFNFFDTDDFPIV
eukprot:TRINITY_DN7289_c0_g1_i1.p1 TRINITY_DN7289_c0_g1~~TRINITY_DN7289_c0_g1_i1.p1  ORF type:complete len:217 (-),score=33.18 TRINITY_DN7289_c0_g1_i1:190-840(-)